jgi:hypothetical protein
MKPTLLLLVVAVGLNTGCASFIQAMNEATIENAKANAEREAHTVHVVYDNAPSTTTVVQEQPNIYAEAIRANAIITSSALRSLPPIPNCNYGPGVPLVYP